jgi:hypothetical protein
VALVGGRGPDVIIVIAVLLVSLVMIAIAFVNNRRGV